jgi:hypothetical protein
MHFQSRKDHSINSMNENKENYSFEKKNFSLFNNLIFRENEIIFLFFIETFRLDISIVTEMLIVDADSDSNDDVSSSVKSWKTFNDEISCFNIDFEVTFFLKLFKTFFRIEIFSHCFSSLSSNTCNLIARYVT